MMNRRFLVGVLLCGCLMASGTVRSSDQVPAKKQKSPIALVGGTIHTVTGAEIANGTILFENGKITALGTSVNLPTATEVVDIKGKHVYPGLMSADTYIGLTEIGAVRATNDISETGRINPNVRAERAFNPESELIPVTRANGITMVITAPQGGLVSGMSAIMMMDGWTWEDMTFKSPAALNVRWPSMIINTAPWVTTSEEDQKKERDRNIQQLKDAFRDARSYMLARKAQGQRGVPHQNIDARWEAMIPVLEGKVPVVVWAAEIQQIQAAIAWAEQEKIRMILGGGHDAWRIPELLKKHNIPVLVGGTHRLPDHRFDDYDDPYSLPAKLHAAGIRFAIITRDEAAHERNLPYAAAMAAAYGLSKSEALRSITLYPAQIFDVADRVGSLEVGKDATVIVTSGDPLEIITQVEMEYIQGRKIDLTSRHTTLYEKYREKYRRMKE